jgi:hypothetical protein
MEARRKTRMLGLYPGMSKKRFADVQKHRELVGPVDGHSLTTTLLSPTGTTTSAVPAAWPRG